MKYQLAALLTIWVAITSPILAHAQIPSQPNIIVVLADDLGYGDLGVYGGKHSTPHLDKLAKQGMRFTDFHSSGTVCSPTRAGLITGRYQHRAGVDGVINADPKHPSHGFGVDPSSEVTFPNLIKDVGYTTALFGKWHVGYQPKFRPMNFGFDDFVGFLSGNIDYLSHYDRMGTYDWWHKNQQVNEEGYSTHLITQHTIRFIEQNQHKPFVIYVAHEAVHDPMQGPNSNVKRGPDRTPSKSDIDNREIYKQMLTELDKSVGEITDTLDRLDLSKNTLILFTSDNGPMKYSSAGQLRGRKGSLFEGGHRVPAIARWLGVIQPNSISTQFATSLDIMPTMLALSGAKLPHQHQLDGVNLMPALLSEENVEREFFWRNGGLSLKSTSNRTKDKHKAMRQGNWKLIASPYYQRFNLYNLSVDPGEQNNLAKKHPDRVRSMVAKLKQWENEMLPLLPYEIIPQTTSKEGPTTTGKP